jgi:hypothetical protein
MPSCQAGHKAHNRTVMHCLKSSQVKSIKVRLLVRGLVCRRAYVHDPVALINSSITSSATRLQSSSSRLG